MKSKNSRLDAIKIIISSKEVGSQEELLQELAKEGFRLTQATLSRDLKQLKVAKAASMNGNYRMLKLGNLTEHLEELRHQAQEKQLTYPEFLLACLREELRTRENRKYLCRLKAAGLPARHDLDRYDFTRTEGIDSRKLRELRELVWVGQAYNLLLAGGSGTGKTYIAAGLVHEAVKAGYRAYMVTLEDLLTCLKTRDVSRHAMKTYKRMTLRCVTG